MAVKKTQVSKKDNKQTKEQSFKNPTETLWGKIIVWFLIIGTIGLVFVSLIMAIIQNM